MKRKIGLTVWIIFLFSTGCVFAQQMSADQQKFAIGAGIQRQQNDFGVGINLTSPYFASGAIAVRAQAAINWLDADVDEGDSWQPYMSNRLGVVARKAVIADKVNVYGEAGALLLLPHESFSDTELRSGGYGLFGFELCLSPSLVQYLEVGGMGTGAKAEKLPGSPIYANGLHIGVGMRYHL